MSERISRAGRRSLAMAGAIAVSVAVLLAGAVPVFAKTLHGGAHGRANRLVESGSITPIHAADIIALAAVAVVAGVVVGVVAYRSRATAKTPAVGRIRSHSARVGHSTSHGRAA
jgi:ABC-type sulfate transport system permease subunit